MSDAEVRTFVLGAAIGLVVMGVLWALATWRRRRSATPAVVIQQIQLPIANPTSVPQPDTSIDAPIESEPAQRTDPADAAKDVAPVDSARPAEAVEMARNQRQLASLSLELERLEQENTKLKGQWRSSQHQLVQAETGLGQARSEIAEIRGIVLQLGATKIDEDVIDLR